MKATIDDIRAALVRSNEGGRGGPTLRGSEAPSGGVTCDPQKIATGRRDNSRQKREMVQCRSRCLSLG
jgi:hypothetical protein